MRAASRAHWLQAQAFDVLETRQDQIGRTFQNARQTIDRSREQRLHFLVRGGDRVHMQAVFPGHTVDLCDRFIAHKDIDDLRKRVRACLDLKIAGYCAAPAFFELMTRIYSSSSKGLPFSSFETEISSAFAIAQSSISVTVRDLSSIRETDPLQTYTPKSSKRFDSFCWLMRRILRYFFTLSPIRFMASPSMILAKFQPPLLYFVLT